VPYYSWYVPLLTKQDDLWGSSVLQIRTTGWDDATLLATFDDDDGHFVGQREFRASPDVTYRYRLDDFDFLDSGFRGSAIINSDWLVWVTVGQEKEESGDLFGYQTGTEGDTELYVPFVSTAETADDWNTTISVQNTSASTNLISVTFHSAAGIAYSRTFDVPAYSSYVLDLSTIFWLPTGFEGQATITSLSDEDLLAVVVGDKRQPAGNHARVIRDGLPSQGAIVIHDGRILGTTDAEGLLPLEELATGDPLTVVDPAEAMSTSRGRHDGWAYRIHTTNVIVSDDGSVTPAYTVTKPGRQILTTSVENTLVLFNIVVSIEWDADIEYIETISNAFKLASDYLYDVTDGQMAFGQVTIYDNAEHWADADFQISTKNTVRPYAFIGGITSDDTAHSIRVGRFWNGSSGNQGDWNEPYGYRTLIHEFGHYGLYLYDEYFVRLLDAEGHFTGEARAACTGVDVLNNASDATNASLMYYQYNASELADSDRWTVNCRNTEQARVNEEPDWQTVVAHYGGTEWALNTPSSRGSVMAGPEVFPSHLLPFPVIEVQDSGPGGSPRQLAVVGPDGHSFPNALVALYTMPHTYTVAIDQGLTDQQGHLTVYGAVGGDTIQVASFDGAYAGAVTVDGRTAYTLTLSPTSADGLAARVSGSSPYLNLIPGSEGDTLLLEVHDAPAGGLPLNAMVIPGEGGGSPQATLLVYSVAKDAYVGQVSFAGVGLGSGEVRVSGVAGGQWVSINSDYNLLRVLDGQANDLASEDGNFQLHVDAGSLLNHADAYAVVLPTGYVPGPLPEGKRVLGSAYEVRFSGAATGLTKPGLLTMYYHPEVMGLATDLAIYHWNAANEEWERVGGEQSELDNSVTAPVEQFGIYALMGQRIRVYLPIILRE
jgi:hypothetical protein